MSRRKRRSPAKQLTAAIWILLILAAPGMLFGGVVAYLSASSNSVENQFTIEADPVVTVAADQKSVTVTSPNYPVYVRVKVVANKMNGTNVVAGTYTCTLTEENGWFEGSDGFWYYKSPVNDGTFAPTFSVPADTTIDMIAQTIQAVGKTDDNTKLAVEDAWPAVKVNTADGTLSKAGS